MIAVLQRSRRRISLQEFRALTTNDPDFHAASKSEQEKNVAWLKLDADGESPVELRYENGRILIVSPTETAMEKLYRLAALLRAELVTGNDSLSSSRSAKNAEQPTPSPLAPALVILALIFLIVLFYVR